MKFYIEKNTAVEDVKKVFTDYYPYLKIEFYKTMDNEKIAPLKREALPSNFILNKLLKDSDNTIINLDKNITVAELEDQFANIGLNAEIFRKSGSAFIGTSLTDNWTLQQQNAEAEELSRYY